VLAVPFPSPTFCLTHESGTPTGYRLVRFDSTLPDLCGYLRKRYWAELARLFNQLRKAPGGEAATAAAAAIRLLLRDKNTQARASFDEAGEDLPRLFHLVVPNSLHRALLSTNSIENVFKNLRPHLGRVCRWCENTGQADRWMASGMELAQRGLCRISGHEDLVKLELRYGGRRPARHEKRPRRWRRYAASLRGTRSAPPPPHSPSRRRIDTSADYQPPTTIEPEPPPTLDKVRNALEFFTGADRICQGPRGRFAPCRTYPDRPAPTATHD